MKLVLMAALILAPISTLTANTWGGEYAKWRLPETRVEAWYLSVNTDPKPQPNDKVWCIGMPTGWPGCPPKTQLDVR